MTDKVLENAIIIRQEEIATDVYSMWLRTEQIADFAKPEREPKSFLLIIQEHSCGW